MLLSKLFEYRTLVGLLFVKKDPTQVGTLNSDCFVVVRAAKTIG